MRIAIGQINPVVGDLAGNRAKIISAIARAQELSAQLIVFPEHALLGYPPRDLLLRRGFIAAADVEFQAVVEAARDIAVVIGHVVRDGPQPAKYPALPGSADSRLYNAAFLLAEGKIVGYQAKGKLPTLDVFEEERYFTTASRVEVLGWDGLRLGISVCEDFWYEEGVIGAQAEAGVDLIINVSASPYFRGKPEIRFGLARGWARLAGTPVVYVNLVGGQDELVFDGNSFAIRPDGEFIFIAPAFVEGVYVFDLAGPPVASAPPDGIASVKQALIMGIRDYIEKNWLKGALIGISGGIDSAVVAALACQGLGKERVIGAFLPGPYTSQESHELAQTLARNLGIRLLVIPIDEIFSTLAEILSPAIEVGGVVAENIQARLRGLILMTLSNAKGYAVLCPGNKSEVAMGYNTLYGDTVGALAPIGDLWKTEVYALARNINDEAGYPLIPEEILARPPTAELRPNQRDDQDLPPYEVLDPVLSALIVENKPWEELVAEFGAELVQDVLKRVVKSEYKRRQLPIVVKISPKAFGIGRRMPITNRFIR